jgi:mRNA-degrading endonuclease toxin of MazEF toxin-antitoxin module
MYRLLRCADSFALLTGSFCGAMADDERQAATPEPPTKVEGGAGNMIRIESDGERRVLVVSPDEKRQRVQILSVKRDDDQEQSQVRYRIGVQCQDVPPALRSHLSAHVTIPKDAGILVEDVREASPAEKARLKQHDLLIGAGEVTLTSFEALQDVIQESGGEPISFTEFRQGQPFEVEVTPQRDEQESRIRANVEIEGLLDELITSEGNALKQQLGPVRALQLQRVGPSLLLDRAAKVQQQADSAMAIKELSRQLKDLSEQLEKLQSVVSELPANE